MNDFIFRPATVDDVPFLVDTIIEAEKSGTDRLSYSTIFGLSEDESRNYIAAMLLEEVDGCELSISSFLIAEKEGKIAAAIAAWVEGGEGVPSTVLKGNLLNYTLPKENIEKAMLVNALLRDLHIEYITATLQLGLVYVAAAFRGQNLVSLLINYKVKQAQQVNPGIKEMYVQVFGNNIPAIKAYEKAGFKIVQHKESANKEVSLYLPSNQKLLMKKELITV